MNMTLTLVGAGEHMSLSVGTTACYLRFRAADGAETDVPCGQDQLSALMEFAAAHQAGANQQPQVGATAGGQRPRDISQDEYRPDPNIEDEEEDHKVVQLRGPSPFASPDDDL